MAELSPTAQAEDHDEFLAAIETELCEISATAVATAVGETVILLTSPPHPAFKHLLE